MQGILRKGTAKKLWTLFVILFVVASCKEKVLLDELTNGDGKKEFCNIEDLYAQPLHIIQKCLHGEWKVLRISRWGYIGSLYPTNTIVNIDTLNKNVAIMANEHEHFMIMNGILNSPFSYYWESKEVYSPGIGTRPPCYVTYVMQNSTQRIEGWYFDKIINDTLHVVVDYHPDKYEYETYLFLRINNNP